jgi:hypothetical protein
MISRCRHLDGQILFGKSQTIILTLDERISASHTQAPIWLRCFCSSSQCKCFVPCLVPSICSQQVRTHSIVRGLRDTRTYCPLWIPLGHPVDEHYIGAASPVGAQIISTGVFDSGPDSNLGPGAKISLHDASKRRRRFFEPKRSVKGVNRACWRLARLKILDV